MPEYVWYIVTAMLAGNRPETRLYHAYLYCGYVYPQHLCLIAPPLKSRTCESKIAFTGSAFVSQSPAIAARIPRLDFGA